ncbi:MAG: hypothetical protein ABH816_04150 [Candidatus Levyibacteriota bacterium]
MAPPSPPDYWEQRAFEKQVQKDLGEIRREEEARERRRFRPPQRGYRRHW